MAAEIPTLEELRDRFSEEISEIASEALTTLGENSGVSEDLREKIQTQVQEGVQKEAGALSSAIYPFLERFSQARLSALSQSILQATVQAIVTPTPADPIVVNLVEEVSVISASVTSSLEESFEQGSTTLGGVVLWKWNRTDITQFDSAPIKTDGVEFTMSYRAENNMDFDPGILMSMTYSHPGGGVAIRVVPSEALVLPRRFLVKIRYGRGPNHRSCVGPWFHNNDWVVGTHFGLGVCHGGSNKAYYLRAEGSASGGPPYSAPWTPPFVTPNKEDMDSPRIETTSRYPTSGLFVQYEVVLKNNPFPDPPVPMISWIVQGKSDGNEFTGQGARPDRGLSYAGFTSSLHQTQPVTGWNGQQVDSFGICLRHPHVSSDPTLNYGDAEVMINDIIIMKHWMDW